MNQLPEKIYLYRETLGAVTWGPPKEGAVGYIRADLLRPSDAEFEKWWQADGQYRISSKNKSDCKSAFYAAIASIPRADSPDHVPESGKMVIQEKINDQSDRDAI